MRNALRIPSFASLVLGSFASIANMTAKTVWLVGALTLTLFVIIESSTFKETKITEGDYQGLKTYDVKGKEKKLKLWRFMLISRKDAGEDVETKIKPIFKKYKITRLRVEPFGKEQSIENGEHLLIGDKSDETHKDRVKRNATALTEFKGAKKSHKKLKLAHVQAGYKNWKNKERSSDSNDDKPVDKTKKISRRYVNYFPNNKTNRSKRYALTKVSKDDRSEYYAQRKAVMDRFHARQREIANRYAKKTSTTPKYMYKYDLEKKNNVSLSLSAKIPINNINKSEHAVNKANNSLETSTSTSSTTPIREQIIETTTTAYRINRSNQFQTTENSLERDVEEDYDEDSDYLEDNNDYQKSNDSKLDDDKSDAKWGNCTGSLVYQHNIIISVRQALQAVADITTSVDGHLCVTCIRVESLNRNKSVTVKLEVNRRKDGSIINAKLKFNDFHLEQLSYSVRMWAVDKIENSCSFVP
ncbi:transcriptional regulator ATRX homolog [Bombus flavifrons]|uniref:transcriptional regulator ATRX homolog n=1 Tax=Bombus flavifrons TaxID=103934 RepID=UPI0037044424